MYSTCAGYEWVETGGILAGCSRVYIRASERRYAWGAISARFNTRI